MHILPVRPSTISWRSFRNRTTWVTQDFHRSRSSVLYHGIESRMVLARIAICWFPGGRWWPKCFFYVFFHFRAVAVNLRNNCRLKAFISGDLVSFNLNKLKNSDLAVYLFSHLYFILAVSFVFRLIWHYYLSCSTIITFLNFNLLLHGEIIARGPN